MSSTKTAVDLRSWVSRPTMTWSAWALALALAPSATPAAIFKCVGSDGSAAYKDTPCSSDEKEEHVDASPPAASRPTLPTPRPAVSNAQAHADLEARALDCSTRQFNDWIKAQGHPLPAPDIRIAKLMEISNACRRPLHLPDMVNNLPPAPKPVLSGAEGAAAADLLGKLAKSGSTTQLAKYLSSPGVDINDRPGTDKALLDYAAEQNQLDVARYLIDHGARVDATQMEGRERGMTALHRAAAADAADVAELLIAHGAVVNALGPLGVTPLILAATHGNRRAAEVLLKHGANISIATGNRETALSAATANGHQDIVQLLLTYAPVPAQNTLDQAAMRGDLETIRVALMHDALVHDVSSDSKDTALRFAILGGEEHLAERKQIIELLLTHGANVNNRVNKAPNTPVMLATTPEVLELLLTHGADLDANGSFGGPVEALACNHSVKDPIGMFNVLLAHGVAINNAPKTGLSTLQCAVLAHRLDFETYLLTHGVPADIRDSRGRTALFDALDRATLEPLLQHSADINATDTSHLTPLANALAQGRQTQAQLLLASGAHAHGAAPEQDSSLAVAVASGQLQVIATLVSKGSDVNARNRDGNSMLEIAINSDQTEAAEYLIAHGADVNAKGKDAWTPLHFAANRNNRRIVSLLLSRHADVTSLDSDRLPARRRATSEDVRALLTPRTASHESALAATDGAACEEFAHSAGRSTNEIPANENAQDANLAAIARDPSDDWDYLDAVATAKLVRVHNQQYLFGMGQGPIYLARASADGVQSVVCEFTADPTAQASGYRVMTAFERLQARSRRDFVSVSLESLKVVGVWGAQALLEASRRKEGAVPLSSDSDANVLGDAIQAHRDDILQFYLDQGVDPGLPWKEHPLVDGTHSLPWHNDPLFTAVQVGTPDSIRLLLDHRANPDPVGDFNRQPALAWAVRHGRTKQAQSLLEHGADPNLSNKSYAVFETIDDILRQSPLADSQADSIHQLLLHGADPNPWIFIGFQQYARKKGLNDLLSQALTSRQGVKAEWIRSAIASPGPADARIEAVLQDAVAVRDAPDCTSGAPPSTLALCLPNSLKHADAAIDDRINQVVADKGPRSQAVDAQHWAGQLDRNCNLRVSSSLTRAGWVSYVLSDRTRALCVLNESRQRLGGMGVAAR